jgi:hypothetical protein
MTDTNLYRSRKQAAPGRARMRATAMEAPNPSLVEIHEGELSGISGGDWVEATWGVMIGTAITAGFLGSGGLLGLAVIAGGVLVFEDYPF